MLPRDTLLKGSLRPQELAALIDLAEEALRTWEPRWSGFVDAQLKEEAEARLGALSEVSLLGDGGWPQAERCRLLIRRADLAADSEAPAPAAAVCGLVVSGNFLFDEEQGKITAWLDWEGATLGDRHQDLTYAIMPSFAHLAEDEATLLGSGMMAENDLYDAYEKASGLTVDPVRIAYFNIYNRYLIAILTLAASARASRSRGTHQDVLVNYVVGLGYPALADLRDYYLGVVT